MFYDIHCPCPHYICHTRNAFFDQCRSKYASCVWIYICHQVSYTKPILLHIIIKVLNCFSASKLLTVRTWWNNYPIFLLAAMTAPLWCDIIVWIDPLAPLYQWLRHWCHYDVTWYAEWSHSLLENLSELGCNCFIFFLTHWPLGNLNEILDM